MEKQIIKLNETQLKKIIVDVVKNIKGENALNEAKNRNPYDDNKIGNFETKPLKDDVSIYDVRSRLSNIIHSLNNNNIADAKKQTLRLYKLVDAMINQDF
jgi:hypothetical protein